MNTCKNCKYFILKKRNPHRGDCRNTKFEYVGLSWKDNTRTDTLHYWDCESYDADFDVGIDFGCIHFEERGE